MSLTTNYLRLLTVAEHEGIVRQILGKLQGASIDNELYLQSVAAVAAASQAEDEAYTHSQKDFNSDRLKEEDNIVDAYVKAIRAILDGYTLLPVSEPKRQLGVELVQVFRDYHFSPSDSYTAESGKIRNMNQVFQSRIADLQALGVADYWAQAVTRAANIEQILSQRFDDIAARVVGELKTARANTDEAIKRMYEVITAMNVMMPSTAITDLIAQLEAIESYAVQYYLGGKKPSGNTTSTTNENDNENENQNENGGGGTGDNNGGTGDNPGGTGTITPSGGDNTGSNENENQNENPGGGDNGGDNGDDNGGSNGGSGMDQN